jgi:hypothetical protein
MVRTACKIHGEAEMKKLRVTDIAKKFSARQRKRAGQVFYGNLDPREVMNRNA